MKKIICIAFAILLSLGTWVLASSSSPGWKNRKQKVSGNTEVKRNLMLADPFVLCDDGVYYAYGTSAGNGFEVFCSDDLDCWHRHSELALDAKDSYGDRWFWAPEVYRNPSDGRFYMFYSADEHLCVAVADSPLGPFVQEEKEPMFQERAIDSSLFIDRDGTPYLFFVRFTDGNVIWGARLTDDWKHIDTSTLIQCVAPDTGWELKMDKVAEGPSVIERQGIYYMLYSANHYLSRYYGVGYATSDSPLGNWTKGKENPVLCYPSDELVGTGHGSVFHDKDGQEMYVFHAHHDNANVHPRTTHAAPINIADGCVSIESDKIIELAWIRH